MEGEDAGEKMRDKLAALLQEAIAEWAAEFAPGFSDFCAETMKAMAYLYADEVDYHGTDPLGLFAPLILSAIERIDFWQAADHIFVHLGKTAEVA